VESLELGIELFPRHAGLYFEDDAEALLAAGLNGDRCIDVGVVPSEADGKDADHGVELVVKANLLAEDVAAAGEMSLPKQITEDRDRFDFRFVACVLRCEGAAEERRNAEEFEGIWREKFLVDGFGQTSFGKDHTAAIVQDDALGAFRTRLHLDVFGDGVVDSMLAFGVDDPGAANAVGGGVGVGIDQDGINHAEDGGSGADAEGQGDNGDGAGDAAPGQKT
jgi:hypothetical protein